jgi:hypothetical protein
MTDTITETTAPLCQYVAEFLLRGPDMRSELPRDPVVRAQLETAWGKRGENVVGVWLAHERYLRRFASEHAIAPRWPHDTFFAEALVRGARKEL